MPPKPTTSIATPTTAWDNVPDMHGIVPWKRTGLSRADIIHMLAKEAKACLYELLRAHVEHAYGRSGWPAEPKAWKPLERERDAVVGVAELLPDERYGLTYGAARREPLPDGSYGSPKPLDRLTLPGSPPLSLLWGLWTGNCFHADPSSKMLPALLVQYEYADDLKEEIRMAFADFKKFKIGHGAGKGFMGRLRKDEQGRKAVEAWGVCREAYLNRRLSDLLHEPFGIERDFTYLYHAACWTLGAVLLQQGEQQLGEYACMQLGQFKQRDTLGAAPSDLYNGSRPFVDGRTEPFQLKRWTKLYLKKVEAAAHRWRERDRTDVDDRLGALREQVRTWNRAAWGVSASPQHRTEVEAAQRKIVEGIEAMKTKGASRTATTKASEPKDSTTTKASKVKPTAPAQPSIADKFATVEGALDKWMALLRAEGIADVDGRFAMASNAKGKGKLIAAWTAASEVFSLPGYATGTQLVQALVAHLPGLSGLERVDKVRTGKTFSDRVEEYKETLRDD